MFIFAFVTSPGHSVSLRLWLHIIFVSGRQRVHQLLPSKPHTGAKQRSQLYLLSPISLTGRSSRPPDRYGPNWVLAPVLTLLLLRVFQHPFLLGCLTPAFVANNSVQHWLPCTSARRKVSGPWEASMENFILAAPFSLAYPIGSKKCFMGFHCQFVHERSYPLASPALSLWHSLPNGKQLSQRAISFIPSTFRPTHLHFSPPPPLSASCYHDPITFSLERKGSPNSATSYPEGARIGTYSLHSPTIRKLFAFQKVYPDLWTLFLRHHSCLSLRLSSHPPQYSSPRGGPPLSRLGFHFAIWRRCFSHLTSGRRRCCPLAAYQRTSYLRLPLYPPRLLPWCCPCWGGCCGGWFS